MDETIQASVSALGAYLGSDRGGIALFSEDGRSLAFRYGYFTAGADPALFETDLAQALPWYVGELREGRPVILPHLPEALPPEAVAERAFSSRIGLKSTFALPLKAGGEVVGGLGFDYLTAYRHWSPEFLSRLELLASVYANALYRRRANARMERLYEIKRSVLESVSGEIVVLDRDGRIVAVNEAWTRSARREAIPQERTPVGSDYFAAIERAVADGSVEVHQLQDVLRAVRTVLAGERSSGFQTTYRYGPPDRLRHYLLTVSPRAGGDGGGGGAHGRDGAGGGEGRAGEEPAGGERAQGAPGGRERRPPAGGPARARVRGDRRHEPGARPGPRPGRAGRVHRRARAPPRRDRHRQGAGRARPARALPPPRPAARRRQLRRPARDPRRERAVRPREGRLHRRSPAHRGALRGGRRRHALPRRDRRAAARGPGQAAARAPGGRVRAARLLADDPGRRAPDRGHQPRPRARGARGPLPRRPLLPPQRLPGLPAAAARAPRGHPAARLALHRPPAGASSAASVSACPSA